MKSISNNILIILLNVIYLFLFSFITYEDYRINGKIQWYSLDEIEGNYELFINVICLTLGIWGIVSILIQSLQILAKNILPSLKNSFIQLTLNFSIGLHAIILIIISITAIIGSIIFIFSSKSDRMGAITFFIASCGMFWLGSLELTQALKPLQSINKSDRKEYPNILDV